MATVQKSIEVGVPLSTAYNQWTQFEEFPRFIYPAAQQKGGELARLISEGIQEHQKVATRSTR